MKNFLLILFGGLSLNAFASNTNFDVKAKIITGCNLSATSVNFGNITNFDTTTFPSFSPNLQVQCSKNTPITLEVQSEKNPTGFFGLWMTQNGYIFPDIGDKKGDVTKGIQYFIYTTNVVNNTEYTVTTRPYANVLIRKGGSRPFNGGVDYHLVFKLLTSSSVNIPLTMKISSTGDMSNINNIKALLPGTYVDNLSFNLTY